MSNDFMTSIFDSVKIILESELQQLEYDTTIICKIVDHSRCKNGEYKVKNGNAIYTAYSDIQTYRTGDCVRVTIPNGDYTQKKFIDGKSSSDEANTPITYISFTDNVVNVSGNLLSQEESEKLSGIIMNGPCLNKIIWNKVFEQSELSHLQNSEIYNTLLLKVDFQTFMKGYNIISGVYGIQIDLLIRPEGYEKEYVKKSVQLTSTELFGDPYAFDIFTPQNKIFALNLTEGAIVGIEVSLFQKGDFKTSEGKILTYPIKQGTSDEIDYPDFDHILVKNIEVAFGSNITEIGDNILQIYTPNALTYRYNNHTQSSNLKRMGLIWYNKDENNRYLGFSDGDYDFDYDEAEYLKLSEKNSRLLAEIGKPGIPTDQLGLTLAADLSELDRFTEKAIKLLTGDLKTQLQNLNLEIGPLAVYDIVTKEDGTVAALKNYTGPSTNKFKINDELLNLIGNHPEGLDAMTNKILSNASPLAGEKYGLTEKKNYYYKLLQRISEQKDYETIDERNQDINNLPLYDLTTIKTQLQAICDSIATEEIVKNEFSGILKQLQNNLKTFFPGYVAIFDIYFIRIKRILNKIYEVFQLFPNISINQTYLFYIFNATNAEQEQQKDINLQAYETIDLTYYDNKYCVYWYKYEKGYHSSDRTQFLGDDWKLIETKGNAKNLVTSTQQQIIIPNIGVPKGPYYQDAEGYYYIDQKNIFIPLTGMEDKLPVKNSVFCENNEGLIEDYMVFNSIEQKYKAVLFYNHEMFTSNELVFTNLEEVPNEVTLDKTDGIVIEHIAESFDTYNLYKENHYLLDASNEYVFREIRCHFDGVTQKDQDVLPEASVYWYIPETSMLKYDKEYLIKKGFITDADIEDEDEYPNYHREGYTCFYKQIWYDKDLATEKESDRYIDEKDVDSRSFWYQIRGYYEPGAGNNFLICKIVPAAGEIEYEMRFYFNFGFIGTNGTNYTLAIMNRDACKAVQSDDSLTLKVDLRDANYKKLEIDTSQLNIRNDSSWLFRSSENLLIQGYSQDTPGMYPDEIKCVCEVNPESPESSDLTGCGIFQIQLVDYPIAEEGETEESVKKITLTQMHPVPWSEGDYYISGTTQIIYNSLGTLDRGSSFDIPYRLYNLGDGTEVNISSEEGKTQRVSWRIKTYVKAEDDGKITFKEYGDSEDENNPYRAFVPSIDRKTVLTVVEEKDDATGDMTSKVKQKEYGNYNLLTPASMFLSNFGTECFIVVEAYGVNAGVETIYWKQPLIITQNRYESPMLNEWDGSFKINEKDSTILGTMLGAGYKDTATNQFNGILMGDVAITEYDVSGTNTGNLSRAALTGLYGFCNGAQSFGFRIDGTAFIGPAGAGQISFDGTKGIIQSGNYVKANAALSQPGAGMLIDLSTGAIDAYNFKLTSNRVIIDANNDPYLKIRTWNGNAEQTLMYVGASSYYLQSSNYDAEAITAAAWAPIDADKLTDAQKALLTFGSTNYPKGMKIDLQSGTIYSSPGISGEDEYKLGLIINSSGAEIAIAAGSNFALRSNGDLKLRGNWEFWCDTAGKVGLRNDGVYCITGGGFGQTEDGDYKWGAGSGVGGWTSWETIAGLTASLTTGALADVFGILLGFGGILVGGAAVLGVGTLFATIAGIFGLGWLFGDSDSESQT